MISERRTPHVIRFRIVLFVIWWIGSVNSYLDSTLHLYIWDFSYHVSVVALLRQSSIILLLSEGCNLILSRKVPSRIVWHDVWRNLLYLQLWQLHGYDYLENESCNILSKSLRTAQRTNPENATLSRRGISL